MLTFRIQHVDSENYASNINSWVREDQATTFTSLIDALDMFVRIAKSIEFPNKLRLIQIEHKETSLFGN